MSHPRFFRYDSEKTFYNPQSESLQSEFPFMDLSCGTIDLSVIVPSFNEEKRLPKMLDETLLYLEEKAKTEEAYSFEVIIVDDGSSDATTSIAKLYTEKYGSDKVRVMTLEKNKGKGGAVRLGILSSRGKYMLMADADGATMFSDIAKLETAMEKLEKTGESEGKAIVIGSRAHLEKKSIASRSLFRTFLMKAFHLLVWLLCVRTVKDTQCGFKLFNRTAAYEVFLNLHVERWAFDVELLYIAESLRIPIKEVAVCWTEVDGSKMIPVFSWLQMGFDLIMIYLRHATCIWQIKKFC